MHTYSFKADTYIYFQCVTIYVAIYSHQIIVSMAWTSIHTIKQVGVFTVNLKMDQNNFSHTVYFGDFSLLNRHCLNANAMH